jgi:hypothetical protein
MYQLICSKCNINFEVNRQRFYTATYRHKTNQGNAYCSKDCRMNHAGRNSPVPCNCKQCNVTFSKSYSQATKHPNHFCSSSCAATYNNTHKTSGYRRSKLETYLETELVKLYPSIDFHFNRKDAINSELDIYIPDLKLAFELNGIFHYEPIYSSEQLARTQNNDQRKFQACIEQDIELCIIDTSKQKQFRETTAKPYLDIITNIINEKLLPAVRVERTNF